MRNMFIEELINATRAGKDTALVVGDLGYKVVEPFAEEFPHRFFNSGIAEQNMMGLSAGLASEGVHVFTYSIANFPTFRCAEQIRNDVAYHNLPVTVVSVGGGLAYGALGYSHHAVQDYGLIRSMPNMLIASPGDPMEVSSCMKYLIENPQPSYLRLGKAGEPSFHTKPPHLSPGKWVSVASNGRKDINLLDAILTTGGTLANAMNRFNRGECNQVFSMPLWGIQYKPIQVEQLRSVASIETLEDHLVDCGFGSWLLEAASIYGSALIQKINIRALDPCICGLVATQDELNAIGGI